MYIKVDFVCLSHKVLSSNILGEDMGYDLYIFAPVSDTLGNSGMNQTVLLLQQY